jgi:uncharacterized membrane protein
MMVVYHLMWDLWFFQVLTNAQFWNPFWKYWQLATASTFLILVGVSLTLTYRSLPGPSYGGFLRRGMRILGLGFIITIVMIFSGIGVIDFGILHLIGFSILAAYPLLRYTWLSLGLGALFFVLGGIVKGLHWEGMWVLQPLLARSIGPVWLDGRWLAPLGITPTDYAAVDFFPILPWFGVVLLGVALGNWFYTAKGRRVSLPAWGHLPPFRFFGGLGRRSLSVYLVHQPLLIAILTVIGVVRF